MKKFLITNIMLITTFMASACAEQGGPLTNQQGGTIIGAIGGAAAGSQFGKGPGRAAMTALGALGGAAIGNSIGNGMDNANRAAAQPAMVLASPQAAPQAPVNNNCREFTQTITVGGRPQQAYGTACRQADGTWQVVQPASTPDGIVLAAPQQQVYVANPPVVYPAYPAYQGYYAGPPVVFYGEFGGYYGHHRHW